MIKRLSAWSGAFILLAIHAALLRDPKLRLVGSDSVMVVSAALAALACLWRASAMRRRRASLQWFLAAVGFAFWSIGQGVFTWFDLHHTLEATALSSDLYFFLFGIPILLAICSVEGQPRIRAMILIDLIQAGVAAWLVRAELFPSQGAAPALAIAHVADAYNVENAVLLAAAGLRLLSGARGERRRFYRVIFVFLTVYSAIAGPMNYLQVFKNMPTGTVFDLLWNLPFLMVAIAVFTAPICREDESHPPLLRHQQIIVHTMPVLVTAVVTVMGALLVPYRLPIGLTAVLVGLGSYSLRNTLLETRYIAVHRKLKDSEAALQQAIQRFQELSYIDPLTKVANRRQFEEKFAIEWNRALRRGFPITLLMMDLDHFKLLNDSYGHMRGDDCLMIAAQTLATHLRRSGELVARYGGEEFAAILPDVDLAEAAEIAESMRSSVEELEIENAGSPSGQLTLSIGAATCLPNSEMTVSDLILTADQALYAAKQAGRNRVRAIRVADPRLLAALDQV